jgi:hypothetical protein
MSWDEERAGRALGAGLMRIDPPASRVEIERIVRDGRRGERRSRVASAVGAVLVAAVGLPVAVLVGRDMGATDADPWSTAEVHVGTATPADCAVSELDRPSQETETKLEVADPTGTILFGSSGNHLVRWRNGSLEIVATDDSGGFASAGLSGGFLPTGVNSAGVAVGIYPGRPVTATPPPLGWVFRDGVVSPLAVPKGVQVAVPSAINEAGDIVGRVMPGTAPGVLPGTVVIWPAGSPGSPYVRPRDTPAAEPVAITADGTVVADLMAEPAQPAWAAVWGPDGSRRDLTLPAGWSKATTVDIRGDIVYGTVSRWKPSSYRPDDPFLRSPGKDIVIMGPAEERPVRWNLRTGKAQVYETDGVLAAVSRTGWLLVERIVNDAHPDTRTLVVVSPRGEARVLPTAGAGSGFGARGVWISDDGKTIHGQAQFADNDSRPVTWTCT